MIAGALARAAGALRPSIRLTPNDAVVKVNIGAGLLPAPGWINIEGSIHGLFANAPAPLLRALHRSSGHVRNIMTGDEYVHALRSHQYVFYNVNRGLPLADNSADYVYSSHVLEHFFQKHAEQLVGEMYRILKPGGVVRICVPDLEHAMALYQSGSKHAALTYFFAGEEQDAYARHYYMYDFEMLAEVLKGAGFVDVVRRQYREGATPDLDKLDNRPEETLYVEATKP